MSSVASSLLAALAAAAVYLLWHRDLRARYRRHLDDPTDRDTYADELRQTTFGQGAGDPPSRPGAEAAYRRRTRAALASISEVLGERLLWSPHGFGVCLALAVGYASLLFAGGWLLGTPSDLAALQILPDDLPPWRLATIGLGAALILSGLAWTTRRAACAEVGRRALERAALSGIDARTGARAASERATLTRARRAAWGWSAAAGGLMIAGYALVHALVVGWTLPDLTDSHSVAVNTVYGALCCATVLLTLALSGLPRLAGGTAVALWSAVAVVFSALDFGAREQTVALLILALPACNAVFDWISWAISRRLIADLADATRPATPARIAWHAVADVGAAVALLIGLAATIPAVIEWAAVGAASDELFAEARADVWGAGRWLVMMLVSTLLPTVVHLLSLFVTALDMRRTPARRREVAELLQPPTRDPTPSELDRAAGFLATRWHRPLATVALVTLLVGAPLVWMAAPGVRAVLDLGAAVGAAARTDDGQLALAWVRIKRATKRPTPGLIKLAHDTYFEARHHPDAGWRLHIAAARCFNRARDAERARLVRWALGERHDLPPEDQEACIQFIEAANGAGLTPRGAISACVDAWRFDRPFLVRMARKLAGGRRHTEALKILQAIVKQPPQDAEIELFLATTQLALGEYNDARATLNRVLEFDPDNDRAHFFRAQTWIAPGQAALRDLEIAVRRRPRDPDVVAWLAWVHFSNRQAHAARRYAEMALALNPTHLAARCVLSKTLEQLRLKGHVPLSCALPGPR